MAEDLDRLLKELDKFRESIEQKKSETPASGDVVEVPFQKKEHIFKVTVIRVMRAEVIVKAPSSQAAAESWHNGQLVKESMIENDVINVEKTGA